MRYDKENISNEVNRHAIIEYSSDLAFCHYKSVEVSEKSYETHHYGRLYVSI